MRQTDLTELHREYCDGSTHITPIPFYEGDPLEGEHGEAWGHGAPDQCMCGHPNYVSCPDWLGADWLAYVNPPEEAHCG